MSVLEDVMKSVGDVWDTISEPFTHRKENMAREDTAVQRYIADMKNAGLSTGLWSGGAAGSSNGQGNPDPIAQSMKVAQLKSQLTQNKIEKDKLNWAKKTGLPVEMANSPVGVIFSAIQNGQIGNYQLPFNMQDVLDWLGSLIGNTKSDPTPPIAEVPEYSPVVTPSEKPTVLKVLGGNMDVTDYATGKRMEKLAEQVKEAAPGVFEVSNGVFRNESPANPRVIDTRKISHMLTNPYESRSAGFCAAFANYEAYVDYCKKMNYSYVTRKDFNSMVHGSTLHTIYDSKGRKGVRSISNLSGKVEDHYVY